MIQITFISNLRQISNNTIWQLDRDLQHWPVSDVLTLYFSIWIGGSSPILNLQLGDAGDFVLQGPHRAQTYHDHHVHPSSGWSLGTASWCDGGIDDLAANFWSLGSN